MSRRPYDNNRDGGDRRGVGSNYNRRDDDRGDRSNYRRRGYGDNSDDDDHHHDRRNHSGNNRHYDDRQRDDRPRRGGREDSGTHRTASNAAPFERRNLDVTLPPLSGTGAQQQQQQQQQQRRGGTSSKQPPPHHTRREQQSDQQSEQQQQQQIHYPPALGLLAPAPSTYLSNAVPIIRTRRTACPAAMMVLVGDAWRDRLVTDPARVFAAWQTWNGRFAATAASSSSSAAAASAPTAVVAPRGAETGVSVVRVWHDSTLLSLVTLTMRDLGGMDKMLDCVAATAHGNDVGGATALGKDAPAHQSKEKRLEHIRGGQILRLCADLAYVDFNGNLGVRHIGSVEMPLRLVGGGAAGKPEQPQHVGAAESSSTEQQQQRAGALQLAGQRRGRTGTDNYPGGHSRSNFAAQQMPSQQQVGVYSQAHAMQFFTANGYSMEALGLTSSGSQVLVLTLDTAGLLPPPQESLLPLPVAAAAPLLELEQPVEVLPPPQQQQQQQQNEEQSGEAGALAA